ncbi:MAG: hypothetical protein R3F50_21475 [Gammaproteobacteria bacterium]
MPLGDFRSIYLPYCLERQENGSYAVLNREYKPVGFNTNEHISYEDYPVTTNFKKLGPMTAKRLSYDQSESLDKVYLYNDGCLPTSSKESMEAYLEKIAVLAKLEVDDA